MQPAHGSGSASVGAGEDTMQTGTLGRIGAEPRHAEKPVLLTRIKSASHFSDRMISLFRVFRFRPYIGRNS